MLKQTTQKGSASFGYLYVFHPSNIHLQASKSKLAYYRRGHKMIATIGTILVWTLIVACGAVGLLCAFIGLMFPINFPMR
ncbi:hypothetical protein [Klebsiella aerogenes]|uniref:hypothetical protein n=1 Tax=Klebsiella aerogenes TaxID=548 RepID=UPI00292F9F88|nr:hypothetical protein [Klebsiella aerogenes]